MTGHKLIFHLSFYRLCFSSSHSLAMEAVTQEYSDEPWMVLLPSQSFDGSRMFLRLGLHRFQKPCIPCFFLWVEVERASTSVNNRLITG